MLYFLFPRHQAHQELCQKNLNHGTAEKIFRRKYDTAAKLVRGRRTYGRGKRRLRVFTLN